MAEVVTRVKLTAREVTDAIMAAAKAHAGSGHSSSILEELKLDAEGKPQEATVVYHK